MDESELEPDDGQALLERSGELDALERALEAAVTTGGGRVVLVAGEAGIGKTTLLRAFERRCGAEPRFLWGACDPLFTPRPLGPVCEIAEGAGGPLNALVSEGAKPFEVGSALLDELGRRPTVVVLEDLHWGDEASLDVLRILARRIQGAQALVVASYRDDGLARDDPFRSVLGELTRQHSVHRLHLAPLSEAAVTQLAEPYRVDASELYLTTGGNPFFVTEALAAGDDRIPPTVRDAVLARAAHLAGASRRLLEAAAISSQPTELWLLDALDPDGGAEVTALDACLASGMLTATRDAIAFRHELARLAVEESLAPGRRTALHRAALAALLEPPGGAPDLARLAHHADAAGDREAVLRFAPAAAERAGALGAHREAVAQYGRALRYADELPLEQRADLLRMAADECDFLGRATDAIPLRRRAIEAYRAAGRGDRAVAPLRALLWPLWLVGRRQEAVEAANEAVVLLEQSEPGAPLASAYGGLAFLALMDDDAEGTAAWGARALRLAEECGEVRATLRARTWMGAMEYQRGDVRARETLERCLEVARDAGFVDEVATLLTFLARGAGRCRSYRDAARYVDAGVEHCTRYDLEGWGPYFIALRGQHELERGDWQEAAESASIALAGDGLGHGTVMALVTVGRLRARRGDPGQWAVLDRALERAEVSSELSRLGPVAAARAEAAWIEGRDEAALEETTLAWDLARKRGDPWLVGELAQWRRRVGASDEAPPEAAEPYALSLAGDWRQASNVWRRLGCPYEAALVEADGDGEHGRRALQTLHGLGARATAAVLSRRLQQRGVRGLPRGPRTQTSDNPAQLTARELEVLGLLAEGLRNKDIADRLVVSVRTIDHHVSAILHKLGLKSRGQAAAAATRLGLTSQT